MEKASVKHLDFQLQREKALTKDLESKCKTLSAQIAQLEQDKAELRREKLFLAEEAKKATKLDERIHSLQKELEARDAAIAAERAAAQEAKAETEEIRRNASASIALWTAAEEQWTEDQTALREAAAQQRSQIDSLEHELRRQKDACGELTKLLQVEKERTSKLAQSRETMESEVKSAQVHVERLQNKVCDLEQTVYKLDLAGDKQREAIHLKDTEISALEAAVARHIETEERLEHTISSLNDRINAAKMMNLEGKGENERLQCDVADATKDVERLNLQIEALKRDANFAAQSHASLQRAQEELKEKHRLLQEEVKEKNVELRRYELTISQLNVELKKSENQGGEWSFQYASLEAELLQTREALKKASAVGEALAQDKNDLALKLKEQKELADAKDEEMVLLQSQFDERTEGYLRDIRVLEGDVAARQAVIKDLTEQLNSTSERNATYHAKILEESECTGKARQELSRTRLLVASGQQEAMLLQCAAEKERLFSAFLAEWCDASLLFNAGMKFRCDAMGEEICVVLDKQAELLREVDEKAAVIVEGAARHVKQDERVADLQLELAAQAAELAAVAEKLGVMQEEFAALRSRFETCGSENATLETAVAALQKKLVQAESSLRQKDAVAAELQKQVSAFANAVLAREERLLLHNAAQAEHLQLLWDSRLDVMSEQFAALLSSERAEAVTLRVAKEQSDAVARELSAFAKDAKASMNRSDLVAAERQEALASRVALLEGQLSLARREKEQAATQLATLLRRFEDEKRVFETTQREAGSAVEQERDRREAAEKTTAKLRVCIDAEVRRKCEYKQAVEELKRLRSESEELRRMEKARAGDAIRKANEETGYWVTCFDRLKEMLEKSRRTGNRLPSIDADTMHRLAEAKSKISPIQAREVNTAGAAPPALKRPRADARGTSS